MEVVIVVPDVTETSDALQRRQWGVGPCLFILLFASLENHSLLIPDADAFAIAEYDDALERMGGVADRFTQTTTFDDYHATCRPNTRTRQRRDLALFSEYLHAGGVIRSAESLYSDANAWRGMSHGILRGFISWQLKQGYSVGSINVRQATVRTYCTLAGPSPKGAGMLSQERLDLILTVKGFNDKTGRNVDEDRVHNHIPTRTSTKKARPTPITTRQALTLKKTTTQTGTPRTREHDLLLEPRDALLMGLLVEHALRVGEVAALDVSAIDLVAGTMTFYREKTNQIETHKLKRHTRLAAETYLPLVPTSGSLFLGYQGQRLTVRAIQKRATTLGKLVGVPRLSPHDLRHYWTFDTLRNGTPLDRVQAGGGWKSPQMVLHYARRTGISNEGVIITQEEEE